MQSILQRSFFQWGWLLPSVLPLTQVGGRAAYHNLAAIYLLWGLLALYRLDIKWSRAQYTALILQCAMLCSFLGGVLVAQDSLRALEKWASFAGQSLVFPLSLIALQQDRCSPERMAQALGLLGLMTLPALYLRLGFDMAQPGFEPQFDMREDNLPWLAPFILLWVSTLHRFRLTLLILIVLALTGYIIASEGRAALLAFAIAIAVYELLGRGWKTSRAVFSAAAIMLLGLVAHGGRFLRSAEEHDGMDGILTAFTSLRSILWQNALTYPPDSLWWGVGMGNTRYVEEVVRIAELHFGHLHNFVLDAWYETGFIGLGALLLFIGFPLGRLAMVWRRLNHNRRHLAGTYLAAVAALLAAALFSFSYSSKQFALYLPLLLAVLLYLAESVSLDDTHSSPG